jgi:cytochrome c peroxidase
VAAWLWVPARLAAAVLAGWMLISGAVLAATSEATMASRPGAAPGDLAASTPVTQPGVAPAYDWHLPRGFPTPAVPANNPMSEAKVALGRRLFFEPRLSITGRYSCASCHQPSHSFSDGRSVAVGATGQALSRSAMALVNVAYNISFGWTRPGSPSLEAQMLQPLLNAHPVELGLAGRERIVCSELAADPGYATAFAESFPGDAAAVISLDNIVKAIATFERTLIAGHSAFDRYVFGGEHDAITAAAKRGMALFYSPRAGCGSCHSGFNFDGNWRDVRGETGKTSFASNGTSGELMRVPTLRNIAVTAPYMHDGRFPDLAAVLDHYTRVADSLRAGGQLDGKVSDAKVGSAAKLRVFDLSANERSDLLAFLDTLTDAQFAARYVDVTAAGR